ncbi:hypothetical protein CCP2SC5_240043 [Azospirillaceae bacterium]
MKPEIVSASVSGKEGVSTKVAITVKEFLVAVSISRTKFYSEVKAGRIKIIKAGSKTLVLATEPAAWLARLSGGAA